MSVENNFLIYVDPGVEPDFLLFFELDPNAGGYPVVEIINVSSNLFSI